MKQVFKKVTKTKKKSRDELGDVHIRNREELEQWKSDNPTVLEFPLYAYEHSSISLSISDEYPFNDRWDAGQIGVIVITRKEKAVLNRSWF